MKVKNSSGREYYIQRAKDDRMANWCSRVTPVVLEFGGLPAEAYADLDRSDWIYIRFNDTTYCHWAKEAGGFDLLNETSLAISDPGRTYRKKGDDRDDSEKESPSKTVDDKRLLTREDLEAIVSYLPELRAAVAARDANPATKSHEYSTEFSSVVRQIVQEFHTRGFMYAFDYMSWMDEGRRLIDDAAALAVSDLETIRKLLVVHWRSDYWDSENEHWEYVASNGHLTKLIERLHAISLEMPETERTESNRFVWEEGDITDITMPDEQPRPMMLSELQAAAGWLPEIVNAVKQTRENGKHSDDCSADLHSLIEKMFDHFEVLGVFVEIDFGMLLKEAEMYDDLDKISSADLPTLRWLLSFHRENEGEDGYLESLATKGVFTRILRRLEELARDKASKTPVC